MKIVDMITLFLLAVSYFKDKKIHDKNIKKGLKAFENILPKFFGVTVLVGVLLAIFTQNFKYFYESF
ncbi:hypothetical protein [uncultured Ilyobacter sp.]|uniref:hypothetical protein n=1 Tax=uncultured Ilyobacter sp. TaxID=544433 RepID=UPI0029C8E2A0|nr:hypothetical protein [uncultured Ilyobacter sp.]